MDISTLVFGLIFIIVLVLVIRSNNKGKAKAKELEAIGKETAERILKEQ